MRGLTGTPTRASNIRVCAWRPAETIRAQGELAVLGAMKKKHRAMRDPTLTQATQAAYSTRGTYAMGRGAGANALGKPAHCEPRLRWCVRCEFPTAQGLRHWSSNLGRALACHANVADLEATGLRARNAVTAKSGSDANGRPAKLS